MVRMIYLGHEDAKSCGLRNTIFDKCNDISFIFCYDLKFRQKNSNLVFSKLMFPIIYLGHGDAKSCVFRKTIFNNFCNEMSCVFCSDLQVRQKNTTVYFYENNGP